VIPLYTQEEFNSAKSRDLLSLQCKHCGKTFYKCKNVIQATIAGHHSTSDFCSNKCHRHFECPSFVFPCDHCGKGIRRTVRAIEKSKAKHHFCSKSCSCTYQNLHKTKGTRVSKLEKWLSIKLPLLYPNLEFHFNRKDAINSELDIYIPSLKLAFELNGIFHYEPIFGDKTLERSQNNDKRKYQACLEKGIELCIIDVSKHSYFKEQTCLPFLEIIQGIISLKFSRIAQNDPIDETT